MKNMHIEQIVRDHIAQALKQLDISYEKDIHLEHPQDLAHGDFATNIALACAKDLGENPRDFALRLKEHMDKHLPSEISKIEVAGPGFINFFLAPSFFKRVIDEVNNEKEDYGKNQFLSGKKIITEFTDPNPFKAFHIGHLMTNTIGESLARLFEYNGAEVVWANYQGDVGMHVAKALWGMMDLGLGDIQSASLHEQIAFLGKAYAHGAQAYEDNKEEMQLINKKIYNASDEEINDIYAWGRSLSLEYFETQYKRLGTFHNQKEGKAFDFYFFESEVGDLGKEKVLEFLEKGIFEQSENAIIFPGEKYGLHNRVFVNALGLPTYEAKELGLAKIKYDLFPYDASYVVTANEIDEYFKVLLKAMSYVFPDFAEKTQHISHGMMKLSSGKMSSRTGDVILAEDILNHLERLVAERAEERDLEARVISQIAVAAIKFAILKQDTSKDIIFDMEQSLSFEGDSGPYLQYTYARCQSLLKKTPYTDASVAEHEPYEYERLLYRFPLVVARSVEMKSPHSIANFAIELARSFNAWYASTQIIDENKKETNERIARVAAVGQVLKNALYLLGIEAPEQM